MVVRPQMLAQEERYVDSVFQSLLLRHAFTSLEPFLGLGIRPEEKGTSFQFKTVEVAGGFSNPYDRATFIIWTLAIVVLTVIYLWYAFRWPRRDPRTKSGLILATIFFALSLPATPIAHHLIINTFYTAEDPSIQSVGVWGGPPSLLSWLAGCILGTLIFLLLRRGYSAHEKASPEAVRGICAKVTSWRQT